MQKITPCLWFDGQAEEAVNFYVSIFGNSKIETVARYGKAGAEASGKPVGTVMTIAFRLEEQGFMALNGGPEFTFNPAVSFFVSCPTPQEVDFLWNNLSEGGAVLMKLDQYPFSKKYGWLLDRFGVSWQLNLANRRHKIAPCLMFAGARLGKAEEAVNYYVSLFDDSGVSGMERYGAGEQGAEGTLKHAELTLSGHSFMALDGSREHPFTFTPAISLMVDCKTQREVDDLWARLIEGGEEWQCGWLKDRYGLAWQIVPTILGELLQDKNTIKSERVMSALIQMKKIDIGRLKEAYEAGEGQNRDQQ
jgi:predicted 3-demethylubiquinone-9 3-methyltransferase (glyoxalase superfamily)